MPHIYVLELTEKTYFIGRCEDTEDLNEKLDNHFLGKEEMLDRFNKKIVLPVVRVDKIIRNITPKGETDCLLAYILLYGMLKVHTNLYCYRCGHVGHYKKNCLSRWHRNDFEIEVMSVYCEGVDVFDCLLTQQIVEVEMEIIKHHNKLISGMADL